MQTTADAIISTDLDMLITSWNPGAERMFGYSADEMIGRSIAVLAPGHQDEQKRLLEARMAGNVITSFETERMARDGRRVPVALTLTPIRDESGAVVGFSGILRDLSAEMEARRRRREAEERFQTAFECAPIGMALVSLGGIYGDVNKALCETLDRPRDEIVGLTVSEVTHPDDLSERLAKDDELLSGEEGAYQTERRFLRPDGSVAHTRATTSVVRDAEDRPLYLLCQTEDITERKRDERTVQALADNSPAAIYVKDPEGRYVFVNRAVEELFGRPEAEIVGRTDGDLLAPEAAAGVLASDRTVVRTRVSLSVEEAGSFGLPDRRYLLHKFPLLDADGAVYAVGGIATDITERAREARELADSRVRLQEAHRIARIGAWEWDLARDRIFASDGLLELIGRSREEFDKTPAAAFSSVAHPDDREDVKRHVARRLEGAEDSYGYRIVRPDGSIRHVESRGGVERGSDGCPVRMVGTLQDVTEHRLAEDDRERLLRRNELLLGAIAEGVYGADVEGRMTFANPAAARMLDRQVEELIGCDAHATVHHSRPDGTPYPPRECPLVQSALDGNVHSGSDQTFFRRDGSSFPIEYSSNPIREDGRVVGTVVSFTDITDYRQADEAMRGLIATLQEVDHERRILLTHLVDAQEAERRRIAADIHDDSVQAMSAVALRLEMLRKTALEPDAAAVVRRLEETVGVATERLRHLLFELSPPALEHGGLASALRSLLEELSEEVGFEYEIDNRLGAEPPQERRIVLYRIAQEALVNVRKHARANRVTVALEAVGDGVQVRIQDDGVGFDARLVEHLPPGHLGFVSMRQRAELAGGWARVESVRGGGTTVECWVPTADGTEARLSDPDGAAP